MNWLWLVTIPLTVSVNSQEFRPCSEISRDLRFPCTCALGPVEAALDDNPAISINCDRIVFPGDLPSLPYGAPIVSFSQRWAGHQSLPTQVPLPLFLSLSTDRTLRFFHPRDSHWGASIYRATRCGDSLNDSYKVFSWPWLSSNSPIICLGTPWTPFFPRASYGDSGICKSWIWVAILSRRWKKGFWKGATTYRLVGGFWVTRDWLCFQELYLGRNSLTFIPSSSLNGPKSLRVLSLVANRIGAVRSGAFQAQTHLEHIDLSNNLVHTVEGGALNGLHRLKSLRLSHNRLTRFNSDVFQGADSLESLDMSENFITEFPTVALKVFKDLKYLNLSSNLIQNLDNNDLLSLVNLYYLDLSRNNIANIVPGTFLGLKQLRKLDISVNSLRTVSLKQVYLQQLLSQML